MRHLANAHYWPVLLVLYTGRLFLAFGGTGRADRESNCPLDRVLTCKHLICLLYQWSDFGHFCTFWPSSPRQKVRSSYGWYI